MNGKIYRRISGTDESAIWAALGIAGCRKVDPPLKWFQPFRLPSGQKGLILAIVHIAPVLSFILRFQMEWSGTQRPVANKGNWLKLKP